VSYIKALRVLYFGIVAGTLTFLLPPKVVAQTDPCSSLTSTRIQGVISAIGESRTKAEADAAANGTTGAYASAARDNLAILTQAQTTMSNLLTWLHLHYSAPYSSSNAAYNIYGYVRDTVASLHFARHWAAISVLYHRSIPARASVDATTAAINLAESLGSDATVCYLRGYGF
jgi:hypothetical protein